MDYKIQPITRRCTASGRELKPGEKFYSALIEEGNHFKRVDYSPEGWQGAPPGAFSFWMGKVPPANQEARPRIDDDLLEECFQRLEGQSEPGKLNFRYVVALLLVRRKRLKFDRTVAGPEGEQIHLRCPRTGASCTVLNPRLTDEEMTAVQEEVFKVLGWA